eukprot:XP_001701904.1 predicted extracellular protein [Chlamydomonas reinhardtii]
MLTIPNLSALLAVVLLCATVHAGADCSGCSAPRRSLLGRVWGEVVDAASAAAWAGNCRFEHQQGTGEGENLAWGYSDIGAAVSDWYAEGAAANGGSGYTYGVSQPADWHAVGHFTQLLWAATSDLGCAAASCTGTDGQPAVMHVCRYYVPGNVEGEYANNVLPPASVQQTR